jgi:hypothetical protein
MVDPADDHGGSNVDLIDNSAGAATRCSQTGELPLQGVTDPARRAYQGPGHELDDRRSDASGQASQ